MNSQKSAGFSVVIPISGLHNDPDRLFSFNYLVKELMEHLRPADIVVVEQHLTAVTPDPIHIGGARITHLTVAYDGPFHKGLLINAGVRRASRDKLLVIDSDLVLDWDVVADCIYRLQNGTFFKPFQICIRLSKSQTLQFVRGDLDLAPTTTTPEGRTSVVGGGAFIITKPDFWAVGGFDERYMYGWGVEDEAFGRMVSRLLSVYGAATPAYHLYHQRDQAALMAGTSQQLHRGIFNTTLYPATPVPGLAVVVASWGNDPAHLAATQEALNAWRNESAHPALFVVVEAVAPGQDYTLTIDWAKTEYIHLSLTEKQNGLFPKESMWQLAAEKIMAGKFGPGFDKLAFVDSHVIPPPEDRLYWAKISAALNKAEVVQPFSKCSDTVSPEFNRMGLVHSYLENSKEIKGTPGYAYATRTDTHQRLGGFPILPTCAGDAATYLRLIPNGHQAKVLASPVMSRIVKYEAPGVRPVLGSVPVEIKHAFHGTHTDRVYSEQTLLLNMACSHPAEICRSVRGLPILCDSPYARAFVDTRLELTGGMSTLDLRNRWDANVRSHMSPVSTEAQLTVACVLRSGGVYTPVHVQWLAQQITNHLQTPHRFICLADVDVPGVETIQLKHDLPTTRSKLEIFRSDLFKADRTSVLLMDLDTVITRDFTLPKCPVGDVYYVRENERRAAWPAWNSSVMYFRACRPLTEVLNRFLADRAAGRAPEWMFPGEQEWSSSTIFHLVRTHRIVDIERLLAVRFWGYRPDLPPPEAHIVTWATPSSKPWEVSASWIPPLYLEPNVQ